MKGLVPLHSKDPKKSFWAAIPFIVKRLEAGSRDSVGYWLRCGASVFETGWRIAHATEGRQPIDSAGVIR